MGSRLELHEEFCEILNSRNAYFSPPESVKLKYPCIVYSRTGINKHNADDQMYKNINEYSGMLIYSDPDSVLSEELLRRFPMCSLGRGYTTNNLNHQPFTLYY